MKFKAVLFDLDGTLIDTAPDLAVTLNYLLTTHNRAPLDFDDIRHVASDGVAGLLHLGFNLQPQDPEYSDLRNKFIHFYAKHIADRSVLFDGMEDILHWIEHQNIPWGIVTNKHSELTHKLLQKLNLERRTHCVVCGDTLKERKPHPDPLLYAARLLNLDPSQCCYIGDAERDIEAAKAAGMTSILATYGYLHEDIKPEDIGADYLIDSPQTLRSLL